MFSEHISADISHSKEYYHNPKQLKQLFSSLFLPQDQNNPVLNTANSLIDRYFKGVTPDSYQQAKKSLRKYLETEAWSESVIHQVFSNLEKFSSGNWMFVRFKGEKDYRLCRSISFAEFRDEFGQILETAPKAQKTAEVRVTTVTEPGSIFVGQDLQSIEVEPGDHLIKNPGDADPYRFGDQPSVEERIAAFKTSYTPVAGKTDYFMKTATSRVVRVMTDLVLDTEWGSSMAMKAGGYVTDAGYTIQQQSFDYDYRFVDQAAEAPVISLS